MALVVVVFGGKYISSVLNYLIRAGDPPSSMVDGLLVGCFLRWSLDFVGTSEQNGPDRTESLDVEDSM